MLTPMLMHINPAMKQSVPIDFIITSIFNHDGWRWPESLAQTYAQRLNLQEHTHNCPAYQQLKSHERNLEPTGITP